MTDLQVAVAALACTIAGWTLVAVTGARLARDRRRRRAPRQVRRPRSEG